MASQTRAGANLASPQRMPWFPNDLDVRWREEKYHAEIAQKQEAPSDIEVFACPGSALGEDREDGIFAHTVADGAR